MRVRTELKFKKLLPDAQLPYYSTPGSSGLDVVSAEEVLIIAGALGAKVRTGLAVEIPEGMELQVRNRSGIASKTGMRISMAVGTIDSDYRGEIMAVFDNIGKENYHIKKGDKICQLVLCPVFQAIVREAEELSATKRGDGGFGSTGS